MDLAYDHITEQSLPKDEDGKVAESDKAEPTSTLNADLQAAYSALSANPWATRIGGFFGNVVKQSESVYREAQQEVTALGQDATKGLADLRNNLVSRTRNLSISTPGMADTPADGTEDTATTPTRAAPLEDTTVLSRIKDEAAKRLRDLQKAEDAADEALLKFGSNVRDFLRDAISIAPPVEGQAGGASGAAGAAGSTAPVLFESKDAQGKRVVHASRFDAQLHVIHSNTESFARDPTASDEFTTWAKDFDIAAKTDTIAADLAKYPELRTTMEKLVPDKIPYADFWKRYYFLRNGIETAEARRRDLLRAASAEEEIGWDEDSDDEEDSDEGSTTGTAVQPPHRSGSTASSTTIQPPPSAAQAAMKKSTAAPRRSDEKSQADSDASYDIVGAKSGAPSQAPNSPRDTQKASEDSDEEEDWE